jgi:membrane protease YdiL (CAAX protease family)
VLTFLPICATKDSMIEETKIEQPSASQRVPQFSAVNQPSDLRQLFFGAEGLRPVWAFVAYVAMFFPLLRILSALASRVEFGGGRELWAMPLSEFAVLLAAVLPALVMGRIERRSWGSFGLPAKSAFGRLFRIGVVWGFAGITLLLGILYGLHAFDFGHLAIHGVRVFKFALFWALMFLLVGLFEEFMLRGYSQHALARAIGFWPAALALSAVFGLIHLGNAGESWPGLVAAGAIGLFFMLTLRRTGSLWFAVGFHAAWDWGETFFYSVPDSGGMFPGHLLASSFHGPKWLTGGPTGPEGSALCFVVIAVLWVAFSLAYPEVKWSANRDEASAT